MGYCLAAGHGGRILDTFTSNFSCNYSHWFFSCNFQKTSALLAIYVLRLSSGGGRCETGERERDLGGDLELVGVGDGERGRVGEEGKVGKLMGTRRGTEQCVSFNYVLNWYNSN